MNTPKISLLSTILLSQFAGALSQNNDKPNVIFILADDMGYGDLGCYGSPILDTPNIDALAADGKKFTHFYAGSSVSTPSRVSLMTGMFPIRYDVRSVFRDKNEYLIQEKVNLPRVMQQAGYTTYHIGKWHLGGLRYRDIDYRNDDKKTIPGPMQQGFDHSLTSVEGKPIRAELMLNDRLYKEAGQHLIADDSYAPKQYKHWEDIKTETTIEAIEKSYKKGEPFFINLWLDSPHAPYEKSEGYTKQYEQMGAVGYRLNFYSMVSHLDYNVGMICAKLKELGIYDNTIIVFTSDNGPAHHGSAGPFKGAKSDLHEGGIRVPCIVVWNGTIPQGVSHNQYHFTDFLPTLYRAAHGSALNYKCDGKDILDDMLSPKAEYIKRNKPMFFQLDKGGNSQLQIPRPMPHGSIAAIDDKWKLLADSVNGELVPLELFDLTSDQHELKNLLGKHPEVEASLFEFIKNTLSQPRKKWDYKLGYDKNDW